MDASLGPLTKLVYVWIIVYCVCYFGYDIMLIVYEISLPARATFALPEVPLISYPMPGP